MLNIGVLTTYKVAQSIVNHIIIIIVVCQDFAAVGRQHLGSESLLLLMFSCLKPLALACSDKVTLQIGCRSWP